MVFCLFGPTASGKTATVEEFYRGPVSIEIISVDSKQVYRTMDIGTAKAPREVLDAIPHHGVDILDPNEPYDLGAFYKLAHNATEDIVKRGNIPFLVGGTGYYFKHYVLGLPQAPPSDSSIRAHVEADMARRGPDALFKDLAGIDPPSAKKIHPNDHYRIARALEVYRLTGNPLSSFKTHGDPPNHLDIQLFGIDIPRAILRARMVERTAQMWHQGLAREVQGLLAAGYGPEDPGLSAIGYREFFTTGFPLDFPPSAMDPMSPEAQQVQAAIVQNSMAYAKRQMTFFRGLKGVRWFAHDDTQGLIETWKAMVP